VKSGSAPSPLKHPSEGTCPVALLVVDFISEWKLPERDQLLPHVRRAAPLAARLTKRARTSGVPVIYANDNFGQWRSDFNAVLSAALSSTGIPASVAQLLAPQSEDYRVLKPKHSAFFGTPLDMLLDHLGAQTVVLCGVSGNQCITATALDAHMRDYTVVVTHDACASRTRTLHDHAMAQLKDVGIRVMSAASVRWSDLKSV
jgi:nicotinamidase-related amidase